jgi:erythromycin esterase-like protein
MLLPVMYAQGAVPLDASRPDDSQYSFLKPLLNGVEVVSLSESIHMTHEFPLERLKIARWLNRNAGYQVLAFEGSPEDVWVSQDAFLRNKNDLRGSTTGLFPIWNTDEMRSIFAYERSTWSTEHPLYITAYDIQPGTGKGSSGPRVFDMLQERLSQYAPPPQDFNSVAFDAALTPLTGACNSYKPSDKIAVQKAIGTLEQWIATAAAKVDAAYPDLPMHSKALRSIPQNLRLSLSLCEAVGASENGHRNWKLYKQTRDRLSTQYALLVKRTAPNQKLILWAHWSHLSYDSAGTNTSVGELLHQALGARLYSIGTFATGGGTIVLFSDVNDDIGYTRVHGVSKSIRSFINKSCSEICFTDLRHLPAGSPFTTSQTVWIEAANYSVPLAKDVDGIVWVKHVHAPRLPLPLFVIFSVKHYISHFIALIVILGALCVWLIYKRRRGTER